MPAFIVSDHELTASRIRDVLAFEGHDCPASSVLALDDAKARLAREPRVDLVVVALPADRERGLAAVASLARIAPGRLLAVGPSDDAKSLLRVLRAGAADYVEVADLEVELEAALRRLSDESAVPSDPGRLIAVLSPNGGGGSSTLAVNVAAALAAEHAPVGLIDMKLQSGDLAALLDVHPAFTLADLCDNAARLDRHMFERSVAGHDAGINLVAPPSQLADIERVRPEGVALAIDLIRTSYRHAIADVDHSFREEQMVVLRQADVILLTFRLDFVSLRHVRRSLEHLESAGIGRDRFVLVVNRSGQPQEVPRPKAEEAIGMKIAHFIPEDARTVNRANNRGVPVVLSDPKTKVARSLVALARSLVVAPES